MKKSVYKRCFLFFKKKKFVLKLLGSNKRHLLSNKSNFSKNYLRNRFFFFNNKSFFKKNFF